MAYPLDWNKILSAWYMESNNENMSTLDCVYVFFRHEPKNPSGR